MRGMRVSAASTATAAPVPRDSGGGRGVVHARRPAGVGRDVGPRGDGDRGSGGGDPRGADADSGLSRRRLCRYGH